MAELLCAQRCGALVYSKWEDIGSAHRLLGPQSICQACSRLVLRAVGWLAERKREVVVSLTARESLCCRIISSF